VATWNPAVLTVSIGFDRPLTVNTRNRLFASFAYATPDVDSVEPVIIHAEELESVSPSIKEQERLED
jgi:hypothetical protein